MASNQYIKSDLVAEFSGENRSLPDILMPPNVSPDAINVDYHFGTLRRRNGFTTIPLFLTDASMRVEGVFPFRNFADDPDAEAYTRGDVFIVVEVASATEDTHIQFVAIDTAHVSGGGWTPQRFVIGTFPQANPGRDNTGKWSMANTSGAMVLTSGGDCPGYRIKYNPNCADMSARLLSIEKPSFTHGQLDGQTASVNNGSSAVTVSPGGVTANMIGWNFAKVTPITGTPGPAYSITNRNSTSQFTISPAYQQTGLVSDPCYIWNGVLATYFSIEFVVPQALSGVYKYKFSYVCSEDNTESDPSDAIVTKNIDNEAIRFLYLPFSSDPQVDKIRVYRTMANGDVFYFLKDVNHTESSPGSGFVNTVSDYAPDTDLGIIYNPYMGVISSTNVLDAFCFDDRLWFAYQDGLLYSERQSFEYSTPPWSSFYPYNYVLFSTNLGDPFVAAVPFSQNAAIIFRRESVWTLQNISGQYVLQPLLLNTGCSDKGSIALSSLYIYWTYGTHILRMGLGMQGFEDLSEITGNYLPTGQFGATAVWDGENSRYMLASRYGPGLYVFDENRNAMALWQYWRIANAGAVPSKILIASGDKTYMATSVSGASYKHNFALLNDGASDGLSDAMGFGVATNGGALWFEDASRDFTGQAVCGLQVMFQSSATGQFYFAQAKSANGPRIDLLDSEQPVSFGDSYWIGPVAFRWTSPKLSVDGDPFEPKTTQEILTLLRGADNHGIVLSYWFDDDDPTEHALDSVPRHSSVLATSRGHELTVRFSAEKPVELSVTGLPALPAVDTSGITITEAGYGGSGYKEFRLAYYSSSTGKESVSGPILKSPTVVGRGLYINNIPWSPDPTVDSVKIYSTSYEYADGGPMALDSIVANADSGGGKISPVLSWTPGPSGPAFVEKSIAYSATESFVDIEAFQVVFQECLTGSGRIGFNKG